MQVLRYVTTAGRIVISDWLDGLRDERTRAKITARFARLAVGNFGDCKRVRNGVWELRIDWGPGYRVYYTMPSPSSVLLLCGGDKRKQASDIARAIDCWNDYKRRMRKE